MASSLRGFVPLFFLLAVTLACSAAPTEPNREPVTMVVVDPERATVEAGGTLALTAYALDTAGRPDDGRLIFWASSDESVATVSSRGVVRGHAPGRVQIAASSEGKSAIATVTVTPRPVVSVTVSAPTSELRVGESIQLTARTYDGSDREVHGRSVAWSSSSSGVATVDADGRVTARAAGSVRITATSEGRKGDVSLRVLAPATSTPGTVHRVVVEPSSLTLDARGRGETAPLRVRAYDAQGRELQVKRVRWHTSNRRVARVSDSGLVRAESPGTAVITATVSGKSGQAHVTVTKSR